MKQFFLLSALIFTYIQWGYSQQSKNGFANFKLLQNNQYVTYFTVLTDDAFLADEFNEALLQSGMASSTTFFADKDVFKFKGVFFNSTTADDIKIMLFQLGLKMDPESLSDKNNSIPDSAKPIYIPEHQYAPHYPIYINTGNPELDAQTFDKAKQEWIKNYPYEVEKLRGKKEIIIEEK
jgi:hypothetical protein